MSFATSTWSVLTSISLGFKTNALDADIKSEDLTDNKNNDAN